MQVILLKSVETGFSAFNAGSKYKAESKLYYQGSVVLKKGSENFNLVKKAFAKEFEEFPTIKKAEKSVLFDQKMRSPEKNEEGEYPGYVGRQTVTEELDKVRFFWSRSAYQPIFQRYINGALIDSRKLKDDPTELAMYQDALTLNKTGGDIIHLEVHIQFFEEHRKMAVWPKKIFILKKRQVVTDSEEWKDLIAQEETEKEEAEVVKKKVEPVKKKVEEAPSITEETTEEDYEW